jgi:exodeoxyribonuclease V alpha subunit
VIGTHALNPAISKLLNPTGMPIPGTDFRTGDRVIQKRNKYDRRIILDDGTADTGVFDTGVFNGEVGIIENYSKKKCALTVRFDGFRAEYVLLAAREELMMAWSCTIHKVQGSEYPAVVIPLHSVNYMLLQRNLLYTAITRGSRYVFVVGSRKAINIAIANDKVKHRFTGLKHFLTGVTSL